MGEIGDKIAGQAKQATGKVTRGVGEATDRPDIKARGRAIEAEGTLQNVKGKAEELLNRATGR